MWESIHYRVKVGSYDDVDDDKISLFCAQTEIVEPKERVDAEFWEKGEVDGTFSCGLVAWAYVRVYLGVLVQLATQHFKRRIYMEYGSFLELIGDNFPMM